MSKKPAFTMRYDSEEQREAVKKLAASKRQSVSQFILNLIDQALNESIQGDSKNGNLDKNNN